MRLCILLLFSYLPREVVSLIYQHHEEQELWVLFHDLRGSKKCNVTALKGDRSYSERVVTENRGKSVYSERRHKQGMRG